MYSPTLLYLAVLLFPNIITAQAPELVKRATINGPCTGAGGAPGVCIPTTDCAAKSGTSILNACPGLADNVRCCTKTSCGTGGNCRFASSCKTNTLTGLCPGPADFKCCVPGGSSGGGGYPTPRIPGVGACKAHAVSGAQRVVSGNPGKVREIYCTRDCSCPGTSDHCCGLAIDFMCSSAGGVSGPASYPSSFPHLWNTENSTYAHARSVPNPAAVSRSGS